MEFKRTSVSLPVVNGQEIDFNQWTGLAINIPATSDWTKIVIESRSSHPDDEWCIVHTLDVEPGKTYVLAGDLFPCAMLKFTGDSDQSIYLQLKA